MTINNFNEKIPKHLYSRFEKFNIPTDKTQLLNFKFEYSKIFDTNIDQDFLFNNIRNTNITNLRIHIKKVSKKIKDKNLTSILRINKYL